MPTLPAEMTAIGIREPGGPHVLVPERRPLPRPGAGEVLVKVAAAGVNRPDVMQRLGPLSAAPRRDATSPGWRSPAQVIALGPDATRWKVDDQVMALVSGGGYAEYCVAHESHCLPIPAGIDHERGGGHSGNLLHRLAQRLRTRRA